MRSRIFIHAAQALLESIDNPSELNEDYARRAFRDASGYLSAVRNHALLKDGELTPYDIHPIDERGMKGVSRDAKVFDEFVETERPRFSEYYFENLNRYIGYLHNPRGMTEKVKKEMIDFFTDFSEYVRRDWALETSEIFGDGDED